MTRLLTALCLAASLIGAAIGQAQAASEPMSEQTSEPLLQNPLGRSTQSLNGKWEVIIDPAATGSKSPFEGFPPSGFQSAKPWSDDMVLQEWRFDPALQFNVPGDWNSQDPRLFFYQGDVWYHREFDSKAPNDKRTILYFGAVNYRANVYLNGAFIGRHEGGFTPFNFDVSKALKPGRNTLVVHVNNINDATTIPTDSTDWMNYGGITRDVSLVELPQTYVQDYWVRLTDLATRTVTATVKASSQTAGLKVSVSFPALGETVSGKTDANGEATLSWKTKAALWAPGAPALQQTVVNVEGDSVTDRIGLRTIETKGNEILLNGKPVFMRGVSAHEETILHPGRATSEADAAATLDLVKKLNGNFIRLAHYPHSETMVRLADERGIMVWAEQPIYWGIAWTNAATLANAKAQTTAMVTRDRNRAAIVMWSVANETPLKDERLVFLKEVAATIRALDNTRPLTAALFGDPRRFAASLSKIVVARLALDPTTPPEQKNALQAWADARVSAPLTSATPLVLEGWANETPGIVIDDPIGDVVDIIGFNEYIGWYYEGPISRIIPASEAQIRRISLDLMPRVQIRTALNKPLIISEFGADAKAGRRGLDTQIFSEEFQARYFKQQLAMLQNIPNLRGVSPWVLKDFRAPRRTLPGIQDYWNRKGLVDEIGTPKLAFGVLQEAYAPEGVYGRR